MNIQFIKGFVKAAQESGVATKEAVEFLQKEAMPFGGMLRKLNPGHGLDQGAIPGNPARALLGNGGAQGAAQGAAQGGGIRPSIALGGTAALGAGALGSKYLGQQGDSSLASTQAREGAFHQGAVQGNQEAPGFDLEKIKAQLMQSIQEHPYLWGGGAGLGALGAGYGLSRAFGGDEDEDNQAGQGQLPQ